MKDIEKKLENLYTKLGKAYHIMKDGLKTLFRNSYHYLMQLLN